MTGGGTGGCEESGLEWVAAAGGEAYFPSKAGSRTMRGVIHSINASSNPPRTGPVSTIIILLLAVVWGVFLVAPELSRVWIGAVILVLTLVSTVGRARPAAQLGLFTLLVVGLPMVWSGATAWPFYLLVPLALYLLVARVWPSWREGLFWLRVGSLDRRTAGIMVVVMMLAAVGAVLWTVLTRPEMDGYARMMPDLPVWLVPLAGLVFATVNAAIEEFTFRGVLLQALDSTLGVGMAAVAGQAILFGLLHYQMGFPSGIWGVALTFLYGLVLGVIRRRSQGMLAPWLTHVGADVVVFVIVMIWMAGQV